MALPASSKKSGQAFAVPNICITPAAPSPIPVPYTSVGMMAQATKTSTKVKFEGKEVVTIASEIPRTSTDEPGTQKGVMSGTNMDKLKYNKASLKVKAEGNAVAYQTSPTAHNGMNANMPSGVQVAPSQTKVLIAP